MNPSVHPVPIHWNSLNDNADVRTNILGTRFVAYMSTGSWGGDAKPLLTCTGEVQWFWRVGDTRRPRARPRGSQPLRSSPTRCATQAGLTQGEATDRETQTAISGRCSAGGLEPAKNRRRREDARRVEQTILQLTTPRRRGAEKISTLPAHAGATMNRRGCTRGRAAPGT